MSKKFIRTDSSRFSKIGRNRRKLQKWRKAIGTHNKIRRKRRGYPRMPDVGYKTSKILAGKVKGLYPILVHNLKEMENVQKDSVAVISATVGARLKINLIKKAQEKNIKILNVRENKKWNLKTKKV